MRPPRAARRGRAPRPRMHAVDNSAAFEFPRRRRAGCTPCCTGVPRALRTDLACTTLPTVPG